jgi:hypothetical protein
MVTKAKYTIVTLVVFSSITVAHAGQHGGRTVTPAERATTDRSNLFQESIDRCHPATGNWVNAGKMACPPQGSGAGSIVTVSSRVIESVSTREVEVQGPRCGDCGEPPNP